MLGGPGRCPGAEATVNRSSQFQEYLATARRLYVLHHLEAHGWNVTATARAIGIHRTYLFRMIRQMGLVRP